MAEADAGPQPVSDVCSQYLATFNRVSAKASDHFYKLFHAASKKGTGIQSESDPWLFVGAQVQEAMLADSATSLTLWHRNLQDHLSSIVMLSSSSQYNRPQDSEVAQKMAQELEVDYVRCMYTRLGDSGA